MNLLHWMDDDKSDAGPKWAIPLCILLALIILWLCSGCAAPLPAGPLPAGSLSDAFVLVADIDTRLSRPDLPNDLENEKATGDVSADATRPLVIVYSAQRCAPCEQCRRDVRDDREFRWEFRGEEQWPGWAEGKPKPLLHWQGERGWHSRSGWRGLDEFRAAWRTTQGKQVVRHSRPLWHAYYGQVPSGWTWPGDLRSHLRAMHGIAESRLRTMSAAEAARLHDALHERRAFSVCPTCPR